VILICLEFNTGECVGTPETCSLKIVQVSPATVDAEARYALSTVNRQDHYWGLAQKLDISCFTLPGMYEVNANIKLIDSTTGNEIICDPYAFFHGLPNFCPIVLLEVQNPANSKIKLPAASTVGPYKPDTWNQMYGLVEITQEMMTWNTMYAYIGWAAGNIDIVVDNISITPANEYTSGVTTCRQLIKNGDGEVEDARFWYINGVTDYGTITMVPDKGPTGSGEYSFYHTGQRDKIQNGMWQELNKSCMPLNSQWKLSAFFKLYDIDDNPISCDKSQPVGGPKSCPIFRVKTYNGNGVNELSRNLKNQDLTPWDSSEWNYYSYKLNMDAALFEREKIFIFVYGVLPGYKYMVDDIALTRE